MNPDLQFKIVAIIASTFTGIAIGCLTMAFLNLLEKIEVEKTISEDAKRLPAFFRLLLPFTPMVMKMFKASLFENQKKLITDQILMAGYDQVISAEQFFSIRILSIVIGMLSFLISVFTKQMLAGTTILLLLTVYPTLWLRSTIARRHLEIQKSLPNVLDLLTLSVQAGKDFLSALRDILARRKQDALTEELGRTFKEIQLGKQRRIALKELTQRVRQPDLTAVINAIIQADELGVSIGQLLTIQGEQLRAKRFQRAEKLANEAPVKILFPVVLFIFPAVLIILMAPIVMQAFKTILR